MPKGKPADRKQTDNLTLFFMGMQSHLGGESQFQRNYTLPLLYMTAHTTQNSFAFASCPARTTMALPAREPARKLRQNCSAKET